MDGVKANRKGQSGSAVKCDIGKILRSLVRPWLKIDVVRVQNKFNFVRRG